MKPTEDNHHLSSDGGDPIESDSPFNVVSEVESTKSEQYYEKIDLLLLAPARIAWTDWRARVGIIIVSLYFLMGTIGVYLVEPSSIQEGPVLLAPFQDIRYPLGTNTTGEDLFAQTIHATPAMLKMITSGAIFTTVLATGIGIYSGYKGGTADRILMTFTDIMMTIPGLPLMIVLAVILDPRNPWLVGIVLTINSWAGLARALRSQVLTLRDDSYIEAARVMGASTRSIVRIDILPNLMPYIAVNFVKTGRGVIFSSVALYFLGILPFSNQNWGVMMNLAYRTGGALYQWRAVHWLLVPMGAIIVLSLGLILLAQGTDRLFNPRVRARHMENATVDEDEPESKSKGLI